MKALFGSILLGLGILIAGLSGLCTLVVMGGGGIGAFPMALGFGALPFAIGIGMFFAGKALMKSASAEETAGAEPAGDAES